ncbi:MAG: hypothetical protein M0027_00710 [Candidatus Dormibacteraeota bacterium]|nr:hypothetical protein [Candidatus Dormibacteraeota bacterium]
MPNRPVAVPAPKAAWHKEHPTIGVSVIRAQRGAIAAAAEAAGLTMGAYLLAGAERAQAAEARLRDAEAAHADQLAEVRREGAAQVVQLRRQLSAAAEAADEHTQAAIAAAEARGRVQVDPELRAAAEAAGREAAEWRAGGERLVEFFAERGEKLLEWTPDDPRVRAGVRRWLEAQEAAVRVALGQHADGLPLPLQVEAQVRAARAEERQLVAAEAGTAIARVEQELALQFDAAQSVLIGRAEAADRELAAAKRELEVAASTIADLRAQLENRDRRLLAAGTDPVREAIAELDQRMTLDLIRWDRRLDDASQSELVAAYRQALGLADPVETVSLGLVTPAGAGPDG